MNICVSQEGRAGGKETKITKRTVFHGLGRLSLGLESFQQSDVGSLVTGRSQTGDALVITKRLEGIRTRYQHEVRLQPYAGSMCRSDPRDVLLVRHNLFSAEMATSLREDLLITRWSDISYR